MPRTLPSRRFSLSVTLLERRDNPSFVVSSVPFYGETWVTLQGDAANDSVAVTTAADGYLRHTLVQADLASPFDFDTYTPGEQKYLAVAVARVVVGGGDGNDSIAVAGNYFADLSGGAGKDFLDARSAAGQAVLNGGTGNDTLFGSDAGTQFVVTADQGRDKIAGGAGIDQLYVSGVTAVRLTDGGLTVNGVVSPATGLDGILVLGTEGDDRYDLRDWSGRSAGLYGYGGNDSLRGPAGGGMYAEAGAGNDTLVGGSGADVLNGSEGDDLIDGGAGDDFLVGALGNDTIFGGAGNDLIQGREGDDELHGGAGDDAVEAGTGTDDSTGDGGRNTLLDFDVGTVRVTDRTFAIDGFRRANHGFVSLVLYGTAMTVDATGYSLGNLEVHSYGGRNRLVGGDGDDNFEVTAAGPEVISGNVLSGGKGNDRLYAFGSHTVATGGDGDDIITLLGPGNDGSSASGGAGNDILAAFGTNATVDGGAGNDTLQVGGDGSVGRGGAGDDTFIGSFGVGTRLSGGSGYDTFEYSVQPGAVVALDNARLTVDGVVLWDAHGFESGSLILSAPSATAGVAVETTGWTRGPLTLSGTDNTDAFRTGVTGTTVIAGGGADTATVVGTDLADAFVIDEQLIYPDYPQGGNFWTVTANGVGSTLYGIETLRIDGRGGIDDVQSLAPLSIPFSATNVEPTVALGGPATATLGTPVALAGSFRDLGLGQSWTAGIDFGDGGVQPLALNPDGTFAVSHTFARRGTFTVTVRVTDDAGNVGTATITVTVV